MADDRDILFKAMLIPFSHTSNNNEPFPKNDQERAAQRKRNNERYREQVRRNIIALTAPADPAVKSLATSKSDDDSIIAALSDEESVNDRSFLIRPGAPLPPWSTVDTSACDSNTAQVVRTMALLEKYDKWHEPPRPEVSSPVRVRPVSTPASAVPRPSRFDQPNRPPKDVRAPISAGPEPPKRQKQPTESSSDGRRQSTNPDSVSRRETMGAVRSSIPTDRIDAFIRPGLPVAHGSTIDASRDPRQRHR